MQADSAIAYTAYVNYCMLPPGAQNKAANLAANLAEMDATLNSPFMSEDPNLAASALSQYRFVLFSVSVVAYARWQNQHLAASCPLII